MLAASVERLPVDTAAMDEMLRVAARARFDDWPLADEREGAAMAAELHLVWRGSARFGRFIWHSPEALQPAPGAEVDSFHYDWEIVALVPGARAVPAQNSRTAADGETDHTKVSVRWQPDHLTAEEANVLRRLIALRTDTALAAQFGEMARAAANSLSAQAERLWARIYLDSGTLITEGGALTLTEEARSASTLAATLSLSLTPLFDKHYPEHPHFTELLGEQQVAQLTEALFGRANAAAVDTQQLIRLFAVPLGLADLRGELYTFNTGSEEAEPGWIRQVLELTEQAKGAVVPLEAISRALRREPYGLQREAQHLILAALVAQRRLELTTAEGGRLGRRALDGTIDWENITGVCRAATVNYNPEALTAWARLLTNYMSLGSIADPVAREIVRAKLAEWLMDWNSRRLFEEFDQLPDAWLTTRVWNMAAATRKSFGAAADALKATLEDTLSLEEGLQRVSEAFADSPEQFSRLSTYLGELTEFISGLGKREQARAYIATAEPTGIEEIESARRQLWAMLDDPHRLLSSVSGNGFGPLWQTFHARYAEHYAAMHDKAVGQGRDRKALDALLRSARWREFEALSQLPIVNPQLWSEAEMLLEWARGARCDLPVRQLLASHPVCACQFRLTRADAIINIPQHLEELAALGRAAYRRTLALFHVQLAHALDALSAREGVAQRVASRARALASTFAGGTLPSLFSPGDVRLITVALEETASPPPIRVRPPTENWGLLTRDELSARLQQWLDDLPHHTGFVEVVDGSKSA